MKRLPALHRGSGKRVRAAHCSSRVIWFQWTGLSVRRLQNWKAGGLSSGTVSRDCMVRVVPLRAETRVNYRRRRSSGEIVPTRRT